MCWVDFGLFDFWCCLRKYFVVKSKPIENFCRMSDPNCFDFSPSRIHRGNIDYMTALWSFACLIQTSNFCRFFLFCEFSQTPFLYHMQADLLPRKRTFWTHVKRKDIFYSTWSENHWYMRVSRNSALKTTCEMYLKTFLRTLNIANGNRSFWSNAINRMRLGHTNITHGQIWTGGTNQMWRMPRHTRLTVVHILLHSTKYKCILKQSYFCC